MFIWMWQEVVPQPLVRRRDGAPLSAGGAARAAGGALRGAAAAPRRRHRPGLRLPRHTPH